MSCNKLSNVMIEIEKYKAEGLDAIEVMLKTLHKTQDLYGCIPTSIHKKLAEAIGVSAVELTSTVDFYSFFTVDCDAKESVRVCVGPACRLKGSCSLIDSLNSKLDKSDNNYAVSEVFCSGWCHMAPVVEINQKPVSVSSNEELYSLIS